jgi:hypothetical protein
MLMPSTQGRPAERFQLVGVGPRAYAGPAWARCPDGSCTDANHPARHPQSISRAFCQGYCPDGDKACLRQCFLAMELERTRPSQRVLVPVSVPVPAPPTRHTITIEPAPTHCLLVVRWAGNFAAVLPGMRVNARDRTSHPGESRRRPGVGLDQPPAGSAASRTHRPELHRRQEGPPPAVLAQPWALAASAARRTGPGR